MKLSLFFLFIFFPLISNANYLKIAGTFDSKTEVKEVDTGTVFELENNPLHPFLVAMGMSIGPVTIEFEGSYRLNEMDLTGLEFKATNFGLNVVADLTHRRFIVNPFVGGGAVAGLYEILPADETGFGVASQFFGGLNFRISSFFSLSAEARYYSTFINPTFENGGTEIELKHKQTYYMISAMLYF